MKARSDHGESRSDLAISLYREAYRGGSSTVRDAASALQLTADEVAEGTSELRRLGLLTAQTDDRTELIAISPETAIIRILRQEQVHASAYRRSVQATTDTLHQIVDQFLPLGPGRLRDIEFQVITDPTRLATRLDDIASLARNEMMSMHPGPLPSPRLLVDSRQRDRAMGERGLRLRTVYLQSLTASGYVLDYLRDLAGYGYEIRVAPVLPIRLLICDCQRAVLPLDPGNGSAGAIIIDGEPLVRSLVRIFDQYWQNSSLFEELPPGGAATATLSPQELAVLRMLAVGHKDGKIARDLGVSIRTVSRIISDLMQRLGAESRFQAGVRASKLGWVG